MIKTILNSVSLLDNIKELHFLSGLLRKEEFVNVVKYTKNLQILKIEANNMFKNWTINKFAYERRVVFQNCTHISLARNNFLSVDIFEYVTQTSPNLAELDLSSCFQTMNPPERNKLLDYVLSYLRSNAQRIKSLNFANTVTDDFFLDNLGRIDNLDLRRLHLTFMGSTKNPNYGLPVLIKSQSNLEYFDLTASPNLNDIVVRLITTHMTNMQVLIFHCYYVAIYGRLVCIFFFIIMKVLLLKKCHNLTDHGVREIAKLSQLKVCMNGIYS